MIKKILLGLLLLSFLLEAFITFRAFATPELLISSLQLNYNENFHLPMIILGWFLLFITALVAVFIRAVYLNENGYHPYLLLLSFWWIGIGIAIYVSSGITTNLFSDTLKGSLLLIFASLHKKYE